MNSMKTLNFHVRCIVTTITTLACAFGTASVYASELVQSYEHLWKAQPKYAQLPECIKDLYNADSLVARTQNHIAVLSRSGTYGPAIARRKIKNGSEVWKITTNGPRPSTGELVDQCSTQPAEDKIFQLAMALDTTYSSVSEILLNGTVRELRQLPFASRYSAPRVGGGFMTVAQRTDIGPGTNSLRAAPIHVQSLQPLTNRESAEKTTLTVRTTRTPYLFVGAATCAPCGKWAAIASDVDPNDRMLRLATCIPMQTNSTEHASSCTATATQTVDQTWLAQLRVTPPVPGTFTTALSYTPDSTQLLCAARTKSENTYYATFGIQKPYVGSLIFADNLHVMNLNEQMICSAAHKKATTDTFGVEEYPLETTKREIPLDGYVILHQYDFCIPNESAGWVAHSPDNRYIAFKVARPEENGSNALTAGDIRFAGACVVDLTTGQKMVVPDDEHKLKITDVFELYSAENNRVYLYQKENTLEPGTPVQGWEISLPESTFRILGDNTVHHSIVTQAPQQEASCTSRGSGAPLAATAHTSRVTTSSCFSFLNLARSARQYAATHKKTSLLGAFGVAAIAAGSLAVKYASSLRNALPSLFGWCAAKFGGQIGSLLPSLLRR